MPDSPADFFNTTGAAHNYSRSSRPSSEARVGHNRSSHSARKAAQIKNRWSQDPKGSVAPPSQAKSLPLSPPQLDLENFDDPRHENSRFVLTSPRSLDACAQVGVKPVDLLYKDLQDYEEEHPSWSVKEIFAHYENEEAKRKDLLKRARQLRNRLIEAEKTKSDGQAATESVTGSATANAVKRIKSGTNRKSPAPTSATPPSRTRSSEDVARLSVTRAASVTSVGSGRSSRQKEALLRKVEKVPKEEDRKSLELMVAKREEEIASYEQQRDAILETENARQRELLAQETMEAARRRQAALSDHEWRQKQEKLKAQLELQQEAEARDLEKIIAEREANHQRLLEMQQRQKERELWEKRRGEELKRQKVSSNLAEAESQLEEYQSSIRNHSEMAIEQSVLRKLRKELSEKEQKKLENLMRMEAFRFRKQASEKRKDRQIEDVRRSLDVRNAMVKKNQQQLAREHSRLKQETAFDRRKRENSAQERRKVLEKERENYQRQLSAYREMSLERAKEQVRGKFTETSQRLHDYQNSKEQFHRSKLDEIRRVEEEWKADTAEMLNRREERVRQLQEEKDAKLRENRLTAHTAERLREEIRKAYGQDSFDRKLGYVTELNRMGLGGSDQLA